MHSCCCVVVANPSAAFMSVVAAPLKLLEMDDMSCAGWKKRTDPELREPHVQWVRGFLSSHNYANQNSR